MKTTKDFTEAQLLAMKIRAAENLKKAGFLLNNHKKGDKK